jgi:NAD(P)-dependent dehydrogenase (short-subunit alcohol dehydrogenase family)
MKNKRFINKVVVVTGGAGGIGKNIAHAFGLEGAKVVICDINRVEGRKTMLDLRRKKISAEYIFCDLTKTGAAQKMIRQTAKKLGKIDVLVNNARAGSRLGLLDETEENWEKELSVGLRSSFFASQEAVRIMSKTGGGNIVYISSVGALVTCHESASYHVVKAGLLQMTRYFADHAGKYNVRANAVLPGFIIKDEHQARFNSKGNKNYKEIAKFCHPMGNVGSSDDVAKAVLFLCSEDASFISGQYLIVDGGLINQEPSGLVFKYSKKEKETLKRG